MMDHEVMVHIKDLNKKFGDNQVLKNINLMCKKHTITGIIGRNGSGKTVMFKCLCVFMRQDSGEIFLDGKKMTKDLGGNGIIGAVIEEPAFLPKYSGKKNLELLYCIQHKKNKEHLTKVMDCVGLDSECKKAVQKYSMGMKQRLAIAQAIMEDQSVIVLDEPMNGLDKRGVKEMRQLFLELKNQGKTILLASHSSEGINMLCDAIYEIDQGILNRVSA